MAIITRTTLESDAHKNVFDVINNRSYVRDPRRPNETGVGTRTFVYYIDPLHKDSSFNDFPYIIVSSPTYEFKEKNITAEYKDVLWSQDIVVRTVKEGAANSSTDFGVPVGVKSMWTICDDLNKTFNSKARKDALRALNMSDVELIKELSNDETIIHDKVVLESRYRLEYFFRLKVSE